jgi:hypothetical protein
VDPIRAESSYSPSFYPTLVPTTTTGEEAAKASDGHVFQQFQKIENNNYGLYSMSAQQLRRHPENRPLHEANVLKLQTSMGDDR